jgi:hypothetical protein
MAFTYVTGAATSNKTVGSQCTCPAISVQAGDLIISSVVCDSIAGGTAIANIGAVSDTDSNTYTKVWEIDPANAAGLIASAVYWTIASTTNASLLVRFDAEPTVQSKGHQVRVFRPAGTVSYESGVQGNLQTTSATITVNTTSSPIADDLVFAAGYWEGVPADYTTDDTDTTDGTWAVNNTSGTTGGSAVTNVALANQYKLVTGGSAQQWSTTLANVRDVNGFIGAWRDTVAAGVLAPKDPLVVNQNAPIQRSYSW